MTVALTPAARSALESHAAFHETLVARAAARLSEAEIAALSTALASLHAFLQNCDSRRTGPASHFPGRCSIPCGPGGDARPIEEQEKIL